MIENMFQNMLTSIEPGCCRLSMNGNLAIKTSTGYKTYNVKTKRLTNCSNFVFPVGEDMFFVIPTNHVQVGDVIIANKKPKCVISVDDTEIRAINYEDSTVETILPERHVMMGNTYFYGKIMSIFGDNSFIKSKKGSNKIMQFALMSAMMKNMNPGTSSAYSPVNGNIGNMFGEMMKYKMISGMFGEEGGMGDMFGSMFGEEPEDDEENEEEA